MKPEEKKTMLETLENRFNAFKKKLGFSTEPTRIEKLVQFAKDRDEKIKPEKFEELLLADGTTKIVIEPAVEPNAACVLYDSAGNPVPAPAGEYQLQDGRIIVVETEGVIKEVKEAVVEEEEMEDEKVSNSSSELADSKVKRLIESIVTEKVFSKTDALEKRITELEKTNKFLKEENETLKTQMVENQSENLASFKKLLGEPSKEPAVQKPAAFKAEDFKTENLLERWLAKHNNG